MRSQLWSRVLFLLDKMRWDVAKQFVSLPPGNVTVFNPNLQFEVPASQVHKSNKATRYFINSDPSVMACGQYSRTVTGNSNSLHWRPDMKVYTTTEHISGEPFLLLSDAMYSDIRVISRHSQVNHIIDGEHYMFIFTESYTFPYTSDSDMYLYFTNPPLYEVEVQTPCVDIERVLDAINIALPDSLRRVG